MFTWIFAACLLSAASAHVCKWPYIFWNGNCYHASPLHLNYGEALAHCRTMGADLVSIHSPAENFFVNSIAKNKKIWVGLNRLKGRWDWTNHMPYNYQKWGPNQPDQCCGYNVRCVMMDRFWRRGFWFDSDCLNRYGFVCKYDPKVVPRVPIVPVPVKPVVVVRPHVHVIPRPVVPVYRFPRPPIYHVHHTRWVRPVYPRAPIYHVHHTRWVRPVFPRPVVPVYPRPVVPVLPRPVVPVYHRPVVPVYPSVPVIPAPMKPVVPIVPYGPRSPVHVYSPYYHKVPIPKVIVPYTHRNIPWIPHRYRAIPYRFPYPKITGFPVQKPIWPLPPSAVRPVIGYPKPVVAVRKCAPTLIWAKK